MPPKRRHLTRRKYPGLNAEPSNNWYFTASQVRDTPSRHAGITEEEESILRDKGCNVILTLAVEFERHPRLSLPACLYFHRVYMRKSFTEFNQYRLVAATCFWLAAKWDDRPVKATHIIEILLKIISRDFTKEVDFKSPIFEEYKRRLLYFEIEVLRALCFDRLPRNPFDVFMPLIRHLDGMTGYLP
ncbi:hypothetical protein HKX48_000749 [Thoreauomyces humboldtii]|nr:hypothetical protein HKX48_000749 [Thoreauomyces humboldtii]